MLRRAGAALGIMATMAISTAFALTQPEVRTPAPVVADSAMVFREHGVRLTISSLSQSFTRKLTARWSLATNALGDATSYRVKWSVQSSITSSPVVSERIVTSLSDTLTVNVPIAPDSSTVKIAVWARRRSLESVDSVYATRGFNRADAPPPPPPAVTLDTVAAIQVLWPSTSMNIGGGQQACTVYFSANGLHGLLQPIKQAVSGPFNPRSLSPSYEACVRVTEARYGPIDGTNYFAVNAVGIPPCVTPRGVAPSSECRARVGVVPRPTYLQHLVFNATEN